MTNTQHSPQRQREYALYRYRKALERGDFETISLILKQAEHDSLLNQMMAELDSALESDSEREIRYAEWQAVSPIASDNGQSSKRDSNQENITMTTQTGYWEPRQSAGRTNRFAAAMILLMTALVVGGILLFMVPLRRSFPALLFQQTTPTPLPREKITAANIDKLVQLYEIPKDTKDAGGLVFSQNSNLIAYANSRQEVRLWSMDSQQAVQSFKSDQAISYVVAISPDEKSLVTFLEDRLLSWDIATGKQTYQYPTGNVASADILEFSVDYSVDGKTLYSISCTQFGDGGCPTYEISGWDVGTHEQKFVKKDVSGASYIIQLNPYTQSWVSGYTDGRVVIHDIVTNEPKLAPSLKGPLVTAVGSSSDGKWLAYADDNKQMFVINIMTGSQQMYASLPNKQFAAYWIVFNPQTALMASSGSPGDKNIQFWDVEGRKASRQLEATDSNWITRMAFSPDGTLFATDSNDGKIRIWGIASGA